MEMIRAIWRNVVELLVFILILVPCMTVAPVGLVVLPLVLIAKNPNDDFAGLAQIFFWTAPLSCAFWTLVYSQWSSTMAWRRMGRLKDWRDDHGGLSRTVSRACGWMVFGLFGSFAAQVAFLPAFHALPRSVADGAARRALWFVLFPLSTYAPLLAASFWRRRHV